TPQRRVQRTPRHPPPHLPLQVARDLRAVPITPQLEHDEQDYLLELSETRVTHRPSECVWNADSSAEGNPRTWRTQERWDRRRAGSAPAVEASRFHTITPVDTW